MGNIMTCGFNYINKKKISSLLSLEGWSLTYKDKKEIYYNKYTKMEQYNYPTSISDYNDIYDFYNIEMLNPYETIRYLEDYLIENNINLDKSDIKNIYNYIEEIEQKNDISEYDFNIINLCVK